MNETQILLNELYMINRQLAFGGRLSELEEDLIDYAKKGIRCNAICPGTVDTPTWRKRVLNSNNPAQSRKDFNSRQIIGRVGKPEEISELIAFFSSDRSSFVTGSIYNIDGGMSL